MNCPSENHLLEYLDGQARTEACQEIKEHLSRCGPCARAADDLRVLIGEVANESDAYFSEGRIERIMEGARAERAIEAEEEVAKVSWLGMVWKGGAAMAAVAAVALFVMLPTSDDVGFGVREERTHEASWVGLRVLQIRADDEKPSEITTQLYQNADLLFMYTNRPKKPFGWLAILARDADGKVHWLQPPRPAKAGGSQTATPIRPTSIDEMWTGIPHRIRLQPPVGPLIVGAVFSRQPLPLGHVEKWMSTVGTSTATKLAASDAVTQMISLTVQESTASATAN